MSYSELVDAMNKVDTINKLLKRLSDVEHQLRTKRNSCSFDRKFLIKYRDDLDYSPINIKDAKESLEMFPKIFKRTTNLLDEIHKYTDKIDINKNYGIYFMCQ